MVNLGEMVVVRGNTDTSVNGWRYCTFWDIDVDGNRFLNHEVANWVNGGIEWAANNNQLEYFRTSVAAIGHFNRVTSNEIGV